MSIIFCTAWIISLFLAFRITNSDFNQPALPTPSRFIISSQLSRFSRSLKGKSNRSLASSKYASFWHEVSLDYRGRSRGRVQGVRTPPPSRGFLIQLVFCQNMWFTGVHQSVTPFVSGAPPPKKKAWTTGFCYRVNTTCGENIFFNPVQLLFY